MAEIDLERRRAVYRDPPENLMSPEEILDLRRRLGLTQAQLAQRIGVELDSVRAWEHGRRRPAGAARKVLQDLAAEACNA